MQVAPRLRSTRPGFRHEAVFYASRAEFATATVPFLREGVAGGEPALVVLDADKIALLRAQLGDDADAIEFADMRAVGGNPARIIPVWLSFVDAHHGRRVRGIGEPIWAGRAGAELAECHAHEALLNVAFADSPPLQLRCPYDVVALPSEVVAEARRTHPHVHGHEGPAPSAEYMGLDVAGTPFDVELAPPPPVEFEVPFGAGDAPWLRRVVRQFAIRHDVHPERAGDFVTAVNELTVNSVRHGGGSGRLLLWAELGEVVAEVRDAGHITHPLAGRELPPADQPNGRGLWIVNRLCDLVQISSRAWGTAIRVHLRTT